MPVCAPPSAIPSRPLWPPAAANVRSCLNLTSAQCRRGTLARHGPTSAKAKVEHSVHGGRTNPDGRDLGGLHGTPRAESCSTTSSAAAPTTIARLLQSLDHHGCLLLDLTGGLLDGLLCSLRGLRLLHGITAGSQSGSSSQARRSSGHGRGGSLGNLFGLLHPEAIAELNHQVGLEPLAGSLEDQLAAEAAVSDRGLAEEVVRVEKILVLHCEEDLVTCNVSLELTHELKVDIDAVLLVFASTLLL
mmetsp:Transcript_5818/g.16954  ORF Transcript_5818/g.16954 Transcript_5818/m.16954 type:complete len:246 (+) Transcript_5818:294-1031(+)